MVRGRDRGREGGREESGGRRERDSAKEESEMEDKMYSIQMEKCIHCICICICTCLASHLK